MISFIYCFLVFLFQNDFPVYFKFLTVLLYCPFLCVFSFSSDILSCLISFLHFSRIFHSWQFDQPPFLHLVIYLALHSLLMAQGRYRKFPVRTELTNNRLLIQPAHHYITWSIHLFSFIFLVHWFYAFFFNYLFWFVSNISIFFPVSWKEYWCVFCSEIIHLFAFIISFLSLTLFFLFRCILMNVFFIFYFFIS